LKSYCALDEATIELLKFAMTDLNLSARAYDRILKVARTFADLAGGNQIASEHISETIQSDLRIVGVLRGNQMGSSFPLIGGIGRGVCPKGEPCRMQPLMRLSRQRRLQISTFIFNSISER
jgi:hypothetical protein